MLGDTTRRIVREPEIIAVEPSNRSAVPSSKVLELS
jgi:hypothetical protein